MTLTTDCTLVGTDVIMTFIAFMATEIEIGAATCAGRIGIDGITVFTAIATGTIAGISPGSKPPSADKSGECLYGAHHDWR